MSRGDCDRLLEGIISGWESTSEMTAFIFSKIICIMVIGVPDGHFLSKFVAKLQWII